MKKYDNSPQQDNSLGSHLMSAQCIASLSEIKVCLMQPNEIPSIKLGAYSIIIISPEESSVWSGEILYY